MVEGNGVSQAKKVVTSVHPGLVLGGSPLLCSEHPVASPFQGSV